MNSILQRLHQYKTMWLWLLLFHSSRELVERARRKKRRKRNRWNTFATFCATKIHWYGFEIVHTSFEITCQHFPQQHKSFRQQYTQVPFFHSCSTFQELVVHRRENWMMKIFHTHAHIQEEIGLSNDDDNDNSSNINNNKEAKE